MPSAGWAQLPQELQMCREGVTVLLQSLPGWDVLGHGTTGDIMSQSSRAGKELDSPAGVCEGKWTGWEGRQAWKVAGFV